MAALNLGVAASVTLHTDACPPYIVEFGTESVLRTRPEFPLAEGEIMPLPVAVITGAANGIGLETARRLARTHRVALLDIDGEAAEKAAAEVDSTAAAFRCDITDPA